MKTPRILLSVLAFLLMASDSPDFSPDFRVNALGMVLAVILLATSATVRESVRSIFKHE